MDTPTALINTPQPSPHRAVDFSPLEFILGLIAVITIPALIYSFFFALRCPLPRLSSLRHRPPSPTPSKPTPPDIKYNKDHHSEDVGTECPVCLSPFADGEDVRRLTACKHSFHVACIDMWLYAHSNCPVCRATVAGRRPSLSRGQPRNDDFHQGLPDAGSLV